MSSHHQNWEVIQRYRGRYYTWRAVACWLLLLAVTGWGLVAYLLTVYY